MTGQFVIRPFREGDAAEVAALHLQVWRDTYAGMCSQDYLDAMQLQPRIAGWEARIAAGADAVGPDGIVRRARLAVHAPTGRFAGFCTVGSGRDEQRPVEQELTSLNVLAQFHGTGVARQLVEQTLGEAAAYLWVVRENTRAQAFYRKLGFVVDGATKRDDELECDEIRMLRATTR